MAKKYRVRIVASNKGSQSVSFETVLADTEFMAGEKAKQQFLIGKPNFEKHTLAITEIKEVWTFHEWRNRRTRNTNTWSYRV